MTTIAPDVIETLSTWEELSDAARMLAQDMDANRFTLGDVANRCARIHGKDSIGQLATEIRVAKRQTLYEYAKVADRFAVSARAEFLDIGLTFSHFRTALRAGDDAELFLARAADEGLTVAELSRQIAAAIGKPVPPKLLWQGRATVLNAEVGWLYLGTDGDCDLEQGQIVTVKVYEATGAE